MKLNNTLIIKGDYSTLTTIERQLNNLVEKKVTEKTALGPSPITKRIRKLSYKYTPTLDELIVTFEFKGKPVKEFIQLFSSFHVDVIFLTESKKHNVWIVSTIEDAITYQLIPVWVIEKVLYDYMVYLETAIVLDSYQSLQFDRNQSNIVMNNLPLQDDQMASVFYNQTINNKPVYQLLEQFVRSFHERCINHYDDLYVSNTEKLEGDQTTPLALSIITFGIFSILLIALYLMGYF